MNVDEILDGAAKLVEEPGWWIQGREYRYEYDTPLSHDLKQVVAGFECSKSVRGMCAVGALRIVARQGADLASFDSRSESDAHLWLNRMVGGEAAEFNDEPGRTASEVAAMFRAAANEWRIEHGR